MRFRRWPFFLWGATAVVAALIPIKFFVADVYRVDSGSMRPTIFGGRSRPDGPEDAEHVLVLYERDFEPERFDLVVVRSPDGTKPLVKRVVGLPREILSIRDGDLLFGPEGARLPPEAPRPEPIVVFDDRYLDSERFFEYRQDGSVRREGAQWIVAGGPVAPGSMLLYHPELRDDYLDHQHRRLPGLCEVNDAVLELEFELEEPRDSQRLRFQLVEAGDTFEVVLTTSRDGGGKLALTRRTPSSMQGRRDPDTGEVPPREFTLAEVDVQVVAGRWYRFGFSNVDNGLTVHCPELGVELSRTYSENEPWPADLPSGRRSIGPRAAFGAENGRARFRSVRILRDLYYTNAGTHAVEAPITLGPSEYFLLGDNSAASTDSRHFGPKSASQFLGRPLAVVWPRFRWLRGAAEGRPWNLP